MSGRPMSSTIAAGRSCRIDGHAVLPGPADPHPEPGRDQVPADDVGDDGLVLDHHDEPARRTVPAGGVSGAIGPARVARRVA